MTQTTGSSSNTSRLTRLLKPRSIAIVGASTKPGALGASLLANLERHKFDGEIHLVNPKKPLIGHRQCVGSIDELPDGVDCAVLAIPGAAVLDTVKALAAKGAGSAVIYSAGFAEGGQEGKAQQQEMNRVADEAGMVLLGPNCLGLVNYTDRVPLTFVETAVQHEDGGPALGIVSQSGAMSAVLSVVISSRKITKSLNVSTGNEANSGVEDYLEYLVDHDDTTVILMLIEQVRQPQRFLAAARAAVAAGKTLVLLHPGTSSAARESAATHTGAMAGDHAVMSALVRQAGVILVDTMEELADVAEMALRCPPFTTAGPAVLGESGAFKALTLDFAERIGLPLPTASEQDAPALRAAMPEFVAVSNPLDVTAQGLVDPDLYNRTMAAVFQDDRFGSLLLSIIQTDPVTIGIKMPPILRAMREEKPTKPVIFAGMDEGAPVPANLLQELRDLGVPYFPSPERALRAIGRLTAAASRRAHEPTTADLTIDGLPAEGGVVPEYRSKDILGTAGVPFPAGRLATTADEAVAAAEDLGYPVVLKAQSADLSHKSDAGGVVLKLTDEQAVRDGWDGLHSSVSAYDASLTLDGVLVESMGRPGVELIVGAKRESDWGPVVLVGFGGVNAEIYQDVRLLPASMSADDVRDALSSLTGARLLTGFRGSAPVDIDAVADLVTRVGAVMQSAPQIAEIDLNPVVVRPAGEGVVALDALMLTTPVARA